MNSSQRAPQTNGKVFFSNFDFWPKIDFFNEQRAVNIDQSAMCYVSIDLSRHALQTNRKLFSNFGIIF